MGSKERGEEIEKSRGFDPFLETSNVFPSIVKGILTNEQQLFPVDNPGLREAVIAELVKRVYRAQGQLFPELSLEDLISTTKKHVEIILFSISKRLLKQFQKPDNRQFIINKLMSIYEKQLKDAKKRKASPSSTTHSADRVA
jgi:hypothetical protein